MGWLRSVFALLFLVVMLAACGGDATGGASDSKGNPEASQASETVASSTTTGARSTVPEGTSSRESTRALQPETTGARATTDRLAEQTAEQRSGGDEQSEVSVSGTLVPGAVDRTGGPLVENRIVSYYGHPYSAAMGVLGQYEPQRMVALLKEQAAAYTRLDPDRPAIPTIELIASVAQPEPGADGLYLNRTPPEVIEQYANLAEEHGLLLLLDIQIGYSTIADEIEVLMPFLERPYVHLAIDPEYDMSPGEVPGQQVGSSYASEIMEAARTLSAIVERQDLEAKVLVVHQFQYGMVINKETLQPMPNVELVLHADGFGAPQVKYDKYNALVTQQPIQYGGFKLFYDQDMPLLSPEQVLTNLNPPPAVISYQ